MLRIQFTIQITKYNALNLFWPKSNFQKPDSLKLKDFSECQLQKEILAFDEKKIPIWNQNLIFCKHIKLLYSSLKIKSTFSLSTEIPKEHKINVKGKKSFLLQRKVINNTRNDSLQCTMYVMK